MRGGSSGVSALDEADETVELTFNTTNNSHKIKLHRFGTLVLIEIPIFSLNVVRQESFSSCYPSTLPSNFIPKANTRVLAGGPKDSYHKQLLFKSDGNITVGSNSSYWDTHSFYFTA